MLTLTGRPAGFPGPDVSRDRPRRLELAAKRDDRTGVFANIAARTSEGYRHTHVDAFQRRGVVAHIEHFFFRKHAVHVLAVGDTSEHSGGAAIERNHDLPGNALGA